LGNILIQKTDNDAFYEHADSVEPEFLFEGLRLSIIDYSLSRMKSAGSVTFLDLNAIEWLFEGDSNSDPQYQVYKDMKYNMNNQSWDKFNPQSNILWIQFVLDRLLSGIKRPSPLAKDFGLYMQLSELKERLQIYQSVNDAKSVDCFFV